MKLKNTTDFPDWFLRRMISWVCQNEWLDWSVRKINEVDVRNRFTSYRRRSGHAWPMHRRIVLSIGTAELFRPTIFEENENGRRMPVRDDSEKDGWKKGSLEEGQKQRIRQLVDLTGHEVGHLTQYQKRAGHGKYSERECNHIAARVLEAFKENEDALVAEWMKPPSYATKPKKAKPTKQQERYERAKANLANWERKHKLAQTKLRKYRKQVAYYEKALEIEEPAKAAKRGK